MEIKEFETLLSNAEELIKKIQATRNFEKILQYQNQYDPNKHAIMDTTLRPDKVVETDSGASSVKVARLPIPFQKQIVGLAAAFLCGNPVELVATPVTDQEKDFLSVLKRHWKDNKLDYDGKKIAKLMMSETEAAELWYVEPIEPGFWMGTSFDTASVKFRLRMKVLANKYGDQLYPVFNNSGDMIAFGRGYNLKIGDKTEEHFDIYTDKNTYKIVKTDAGWISAPEKNIIGKIPVVFYSQEFPEWYDVQALIERAEVFLSNHADMDDYNGSPMIFLEGEIEGFAKKGEQGKVLQGKNGAKASYLSWVQSIESLKMEWQNLRSLIFDMTGTTDISIEQMKSLGTYSGTALKMLFLGAHLKAADKEETFGKSVQRRINFMKAALAVINTSYEKVAAMTIEPKFEYYMPKNVQEIIEMLSTATAGKATMSQATAVSQNPLVKDPESELNKIKEDTVADLNV